MIGTIFEVIAPVFLVIGAGFIAVKLRYFPLEIVTALTKYTLGFAIPCLLFRAVMRLDLAQDFEPGVLISFYTGAASCFFIGILAARFIFKRRPGEAVAIGFAALFSNTVLLGIAIVDRAYGPETLQYTFTIISIHAPFCYILGITMMEALRGDGRTVFATLRAIVKAALSNPLMIGVCLGFAANLTQISLPVVVEDALDMVIASALPAAIFALGGTLTSYRIGDKLPQVALIGALSLFVHPGIAWVIGTQVFDLADAPLRAAVLTAAMAPGVNAYIFAALYNRAVGAASASVLILTPLAILTVPIWIHVLG